MQMNLDELKQFLRKFSVNGEELFKVRHLLSVNLEALMEMDEAAEAESCLVTYKTALHLLEYQCQQNAFYDAVSIDIIVRLFIHMDTKVKQIAKRYQ